MSSSQPIQQVLSAPRDLVPSRDSGRRASGTSDFTEILRRDRAEQETTTRRSDTTARRGAEDRTERPAPAANTDDPAHRPTEANDRTDRGRSGPADENNQASPSQPRDRAEPVSRPEDAETPAKSETTRIGAVDAETIVTTGTGAVAAAGAETPETTGAEALETLGLNAGETADAETAPPTVDGEAVLPRAAEAEIGVGAETVVAAIPPAPAPTPIPTQGMAPAEGATIVTMPTPETAAKPAEAANPIPAKARPAAIAAPAGATGEANRAAIAGNAASPGGAIALQASPGNARKPAVDGAPRGDADTAATARIARIDAPQADPDAAAHRISDPVKPVQLGPRPGYAPAFSENLRQAMAGTATVGNTGTADPMLDTTALGAMPRGTLTFGDIRLSPINSPAANPSLSAPAIAAEIVRAANNGRTRFEIRLDPPELGRIDVKLDIADDGQVRTHLIVEKSETLDLLQRDGRSLERALQQAGLKSEDGSLQFSLRDGEAEARDPSGENLNAEGGNEAAADDPTESAPVAAAARNMIAYQGLDLVV